MTAQTPIRPVIVDAADLSALTQAVATLTAKVDALAAPEPRTWLPRVEAAKLMGISLKTLDARRPSMKTKRVGSRVFIHRSEV